MHERRNQGAHSDPPHFHGRSHPHRSLGDGPRLKWPYILPGVPQELSLLPRRRFITREIEINAPCAVVWKVVTDFPVYGSWNPSIRRIAGELIVGRRLRVIARLPCGLPMPLLPRVLEVGAERKIRWLGSLLLPGLLDGEHLFIFEPLGKTKVLFVQREDFSGVLLPVMWSWLREQGNAAFERMNRALKVVAERLCESPS
jgi:hypothetical protein